jgi:hypothetical protein
MNTVASVVHGWTYHLQVMHRGGEHYVRHSTSGQVEIQRWRLFGLQETVGMLYVQLEPFVLLETHLSAKDYLLGQDLGKILSLRLSHHGSPLGLSLRLGSYQDSLSRCAPS